MNASMNDFSGSSLEVQYDLRPAKQVERWMLIDALQELSRNGFPIGEYKYTGMGAIYFVDFVMLHKLLGLHRLHSVEKDRSVESRIRFNRPFACIELSFKTIGEVIPTLDSDLRHLLWLDYDYQITENMIADVVSAGAELSPGSLVLITVDTEPPGSVRDSDSLEQYFDRHASKDVPFGLQTADFTQGRLAEISVRTLVNALERGLRGRAETEFIPLFNFRYRDGHRMASVGGVLGTERHRRAVDSCNWENRPYIRRDINEEPFIISVPKMTRKERLHLDSMMPCQEGWTPEAFEMSEEAVENYRILYRFYPAYREVLL